MKYFSEEKATAAASPLLPKEREGEVSRAGTLPSEIYRRDEAQLPIDPQPFSPRRMPPLSLRLKTFQGGSEFLKLMAYRDLIGPH